MRRMRENGCMSVTKGMKNQIYIILVNIHIDFKEKIY